MAPIASYNSLFPNDTLFDTGVAYIGATGAASAFATRGGFKFDPGREIRQTTYDGQKSEVVGLDRVVYWRPMMDVTLIQFGESVIPYIDSGASHVGSTGHRTYTPVAGGVYYVKAGQYIANLRLIFQRSGGGFVELSFPFALCTKWDIKGVDRAEAEIVCQFKAARDPGGSVNEGGAPYVIRTLSALAS